jgi:hypothetical protein
MIKTCIIHEKENINFFNRNKTNIQNNSFKIKDLNLIDKDNQSTKKRISNENKKNKLNIESILNEKNIYQLFAKRKQIMKKKFNNKKIIFSFEDKNESLEFILYKDQNIFSANPFNEKLIRMVNDEDVLSDDELIEKSTNIVYSNLNKGIEDFQKGNIE